MYWLESLGLSLLLLAIVSGLLSLWFHSDSGRAVALRFPGFAALLHSRVLTPLMLGAGVGLLLLSAWKVPVSPPSAPSPQQTHSPAPTPEAIPAAAIPDLPAAALPAVVPSAPAAKIPEPHAAPPLRPQQLAARKPSESGHIAPPRTAPMQHTQPDVPERTAKRNIFSAQCTRLLEKVGAGEPMTPQEQHEMVSKCQ